MEIADKISFFDSFDGFQNKYLDKKIVFTNGCFDLIHKGHLTYLREAKKLGDVLIIGLNSDLSVKKIKGPNRPIKDEETRAMLLASLFYVDEVVLFNEETPLRLIEKLSPNILVKGGDYKTEAIVGYDFIIKNGGNVITLPFINGESTTSIIAKIKKI